MNGPARCLALCALAALAALATPVAATPASKWNISLHITEGEDASEHEFPSQVYLLSRIYQPWSNKRTYITCGGTIISRKWILTAAHCVNASERTEVSAGSRDIGNGWRSGKSVATRIIVHEKYRLYGRNDNNAANDVALVEVALPLDGRKMVAAALATGDPPRRKGVVVGWGATEQEKFSQILQKLDVNIIPCPVKTPNVICIRSRAGSGMCTGDSGGPLLVDGVLHGVASYLEHEDETVEPNEHCGDARSWGVFMRVASFRRWIRKHSGV